ncbi:tetratricopeptide repeat protein [Massilia endophytica]|uniref:tetratricopeptide repeat protein n=1 Tax=Massilia endophytica TaxID=2899220 RepID=UPI001E367B21|nr:tetratricopeptide repeat protein [Massilia endophytica]UGQ47102.1 tetratricopeptide repeat protein [Massilia endophytica]
MSAAPQHHYNPAWLSDDDLVSNFVARQADFDFLRGELARAPLHGSVQHYLLVGVRGAGKTTMLRRLAVAIRRDPELSDHLIGLSFPEELYQVKNLADFWWAACDALLDELDTLGQADRADALAEEIEQARRTRQQDDPISGEGCQLLLRCCADLQRRPVLLVDNLDMVFQRIDNSGRKRSNPQAPAYWALREALSTADSPVVVGGSVRLTEAFTSYDKAFYDFFMPKRLGRLELEEVQRVLLRLAEARQLPELAQRLRERPGRITVLFELTGGNPRALGLIFELLRSGPNGRAVEDFERLMDLTTPYYKARIEDLSEQAQVIMHALAVPATSDGLQFGATAASIAAYVNLPTTTVSAQMAALENEGLVEKSAAHGRTQYRITEQLFRLWLQMRATRRIRQNVLGLTRFFEAMYEPDELQEALKEPCGASHLAEAKYAFAVAGAGSMTEVQRKEIETYGMGKLREHLADHGGEMQDYLADKPSASDAQQAIATVAMAKALAERGEFEEAERRFRKAIDLDPRLTSAWFGLADLLDDGMQRYEEAEAAYRKVAELNPDMALSWTVLAMFLEDKRYRFEEAEQAYRRALELEPGEGETWILLGNLLAERLGRAAEAEPAFRKGMALIDAPWPAMMLAQILALQLKRPAEALKELDAALARYPEDSSLWATYGSILSDLMGEPEKGEAAIRKAIALDPGNAVLLGDLAGAQAKDGRLAEALATVETALKMVPDDAALLALKGMLLGETDRAQAEAALRKAVEIDPSSDSGWIELAKLLGAEAEGAAEAEAAYRNVLERRPGDAAVWGALGHLLVQHTDRYVEATEIYRKATELDPASAVAWNNLGNLLWEYGGAPEEAEQAYQRSIASDAGYALPWCNLARLLEHVGRLDEALEAHGRARAIQPDLEPFWEGQRLKVVTRKAVAAATEALERKDAAALAAAMEPMFMESEHIAAIAVSEEFIEGLLGPALAVPERAVLLHAELKRRGFDRHARPLRLAFEAALTGQAALLDELEPELQAATKAMLARLQATPVSG